jgi:hypothetical protein
MRLVVCRELVELTDLAASRQTMLNAQKEAPPRLLYLDGAERLLTALLERGQVELGHFYLLIRRRQFLLPAIGLLGIVGF